MKVSVSFIKSIYDINRTIQKIEETNADFIHVDLMDGKFVENKTLSIDEVKTHLKDSKKLLDVHLMVEDPLNWVEALKNLNVKFFTFHLESVDNPKALIDIIHNYGIKCGITLKPKTNIDELIPYLDLVDQILVMSVEPGEGGQEFLMDTIEKLKMLNNLKQDFIINVDGGINDQTIHLVKPYADMVVSGSYICMKEDFQAQINTLKS